MILRRQRRRVPISPSRRATRGGCGPAWLRIALAAAAMSCCAAASGPFPPSACRQRQRELARIAGDGVILVQGAADTELGDFRQAKNFLYLTGVRTPGAALVLVPPGDASAGAAGDARGRSAPRTILFLPAKSEHWERWNGPRLSPGGEARKRTGAEETLAADQLAETLRELLEDHPRLLAEIDPASGDPVGMVDRDLLGELREHVPELVVQPLQPLLATLRLIKSPAEIAAIEEAVRITIRAHREAARRVAPGVPEYLLEGTIEGTFRSLGAAGPAFASIIGSGPNSCVLHYRRNERTMAAGEVVLIDVGAEYEGYAADLTRTYPVSGRFTPAQRGLVEVVLEARQSAIEAVRPGATLHDVHRAARKVLVHHGLEKQFWHGTSHFLGLDVHDAGPASEPLRPGMVLTVEPGVYLPEKGIGIRIEDDVLVTEEGARVLSRDLPRTVEGIEAWVRGV